MPTPQEIQQYAQLASLFMPRQQGITLGGLTSPQGLLGLGLLGGSFLGKEEPGYVTEARQNIRNLSSPTGFASGFTNTVGGLQSQFQPLIEQQRNRALNEISQRYTAAFPGTLGAQPQEFKGYETYLRDQFMPATQAFYGNIGLQGLQQQQQAASKILELDRPDPFKQALAQLGGSLILGSGQQGGGGFGGFGAGQGGIGDILNSVLGGGQQPPGGGGWPGTGGFGGNFGQGIGNLLASVGTNAPGGAFPRGIEQALSPAVAQSFVSGIQAAFPVGTFAGGFGGLEPLGNGLYAVTQSSGQAVGVFNPATGMVTNSATGATTPLQAGGGGFLSSVATPLAAGLGGFFSGQAIGKQLPGSQLGAAAAGGAGGAAAGAIAGAAMGAIFDGPGAAVGAIIGGLAGVGGGFLGSRGAAHQLKATQLANDQKSQQGTFGSMAAFWTSALGDSGYQDLDGWNSFTQNLSQRVNNPSESYSYGGISANVDQVDAMPHFGSRLLLKQIQQGGHPEITSLDQLPPAPDGTTFRQTYIDYIMSNTWIGGEGSAGLSRPSLIGQKGGLLEHAGL